MSDLLNQASLVMVPSGYKEDTVYSVVPSDGSGDLSFTRASNGTRVNSAGLVEDCPWNLLQQSETFDNAIWTKTNTSVTANTTTSPDGTNTADKLIVNNGVSIGSAFVQQAITKSASSTTYSYTCYAKQSELNAIRVYVRDSISAANFAQVYYNINDGSVITAATSGGTFSAASSTITSVANGFYRINLTFTSSTDTQLQLRIYPYDTVKTTGNGTDGLFIWGAQLNIGSTAKPYFPTTDRLNVPRLTYQNGGGGCPSLLLEKQSTNILLNSEELNSWLKIDTSVTSNSTTSPDGTQNADTVTATGSGSLSHLIYQNLSFTSGTAYAYSVFAKANTSNFIQMVFSGDFVSGSYANFDLSNGTITASANLTPKIESMGSGWYRCSISATAGVSSTNSQIIYLINSGTASRGQAFTANGESVYLWGGQFEASSYPTSYIPTTSASATRVADACYKTGISSLIGQSEGVVFIDINRNYITSSYDRYFAVDDADASIYRTGIYLFPEPSIDGRIYLSIRNNNTAIYEYTYNNTTMARLKVAMAYKSGDIAYYINGTQVATSSATFTFAHTLSRVLSSGVGQSINEAVIFPTRLTNAELASLTTI